MKTHQYSFKGQADSLTSEINLTSSQMKEGNFVAGNSGSLKKIPKIISGFMTVVVAALLTLFVGCSSSKIEEGIWLPSVFSDNMVLQQNTNAPFWGKANPGSLVTVTAEWGVEESVEVSSEGTWNLLVPVYEAGGPYKVVISCDDSEFVIENVLLGEVWLASGQSNMDMTLNGYPPNELVAGAQEAIEESNYPEIRMFTVEKNVSLDEMDDVSGSWDVSSPENSEKFSAVAYFFARKLHRDLAVPVGIIHSSWGGTPAEAWMSSGVLSIDKDFQEFVSKIDEFKILEKSYNDWLQNLEMLDISQVNNIDPLVGIDVYDEWASAVSTSDSDWGIIPVPGLIETTEIGEFDGVIWLRKFVDIPESWEGNDLILSLGPIDDRDVTYFNGERIGAIEEGGFYQAERKYTIAAELVEQGEALIAVRVIDTQGGGGIYGRPDLVKIYPVDKEDEAISLAGEWKYKLAAEIKGNKMYMFEPETNIIESRPIQTFAINSHTPSVLFNAMIAPLTPYSIKGAIWYQGETNVGRANQYMRLKSMLVTDWRNHFENDELSFYYVQLAPYHYNDPEGRGSAVLRDAQRRMQIIPNTGMISTLDIGDLVSIHPANKVDVGERLARWALAKDYKLDVKFSGPQPKEKTIENNKVAISFSYADGGLIINTKVPEQFEIAGKDGVFYPAKAEIVDNVILFSSQNVPDPIDVRYAYRNNALASLFNGEGLPAPSFTTENELKE